LINAADFNSVFKTSRRSRDSYFVILAIKNNHPYPRLGMAVSKKAVRGAVPRNKVKRIIRESFRRNAELLSGLDIVVLADKKIRYWENKKMSRSLHKHWQRILQCGY